MQTRPVQFLITTKAFLLDVTETFQNKSDYAWMYYNVPGRIAVNMILCTGSAGLVAVLIAGCAQLRNRSHSTNVNEIANGILGALVAITSGCPFVSPGWAIGIGGNVYCIVGSGRE
eukprot:m.80803 g.80803  ORF g.80803 m.80803 type:complete len:116 (+) comp36205_c0_seq26:1370-1717(+)